MQRPLILISNDDGIQAPGLNELIRFVSSFGDVLVVAPDSPRSGAACSLSVQNPITHTLVRRDPGLSVYKCSGTPSDCIKLAKHDLLRDRKPDLVLGGINHGDNTATNVHYSGTMGVVIEGCLSGIPSIGFSVESHDLHAKFDHCREVVRKIVRSVLEDGLPVGICLNVNMPSEGDIKGIRICRQARGVWKQEWDKRVRSNGQTYFWLMGLFENQEPEAEDTDTWGMQHGYAAITPTKIDVTAYEYMSLLEKRFE